MDLKVFMEPLGENIWVLENKILVENVDLEGHQHMGDNLRAWDLMKKKYFNSVNHWSE